MTIHELSVQAQREELVTIIGKLSASLATVRDAFSHGRELPVDQLHKELGNLIEEIAFTSVRADEHQPGSRSATGDLRSATKVFSAISISLPPWYPA